jgi:preprotein translocase subunit SecD
MNFSERPKPFQVLRAVCATPVMLLAILPSCSSPSPTLHSVGGVVLEFAVDDTKGTQPPSQEVLARSVNVIRKRLDPVGDKGVTVRVTEESRFEVSLPGTDGEERKRAIDLISRLGSLEFSVVANPRDHHSIIESALKNSADRDEVEDNGEVVAVWLSQRSGEPEGSAVDLSKFVTATRKVQRGDASEVQQILVVRDLDDERLTGEFLARVGVGLDETGSACINLAFDNEGARRAKLLTHRYSPAANGFKRQLAIVFDGQIHSAPNTNGIISDQCQITGSFSREELQNLVDALNSGVLEVPLISTPVRERVVHPMKDGPASSRQ